MPHTQITIRDHTSESNLFVRRALVAFLFTLILTSILLSNLYHLQVKSHESYQTRSNDNRISVRPIAPNRGLIFDRNGKILAENRPTYSLEVMLEKSEKVDKILPELTKIVSLSEEQQKNFIKSSKRHRRFKSLTIKSNLSEEEVAKFSVHQHKFPGVTIEARLTRFYPYAEALTHVVGYVGKINKKELKAIDEKDQSANYAASYDIGKQGIEKYYEEQLHGTVGYREVEINSRGRILRTLSIEPPIPGNDLTLSIDIDLQKTIQAVLGQRRGAVIAMDPRDGSILAAYSNPSYDPNLFVHGISSKDYRPLIQSLDRPLINRLTQGRYPPASTVKPFVALLGLETGLVSEHTKIHDPGFYQIPRVSRKYRDWKKWGHGSVDLAMSIAQSCDIYYYDLSYRLGIDKISDFMIRFGFGEKTGIDIHEETSAIMPSRGWKRATHNLPWYAGDTISVGIGQGYWTVTPMQLTTAISTLVNKGNIKTPHFVMQQRVHKPLTDNQASPNSNENQQTEQTELPYNIYTEIDEYPPIELNNPEHWDIIHNAMRETVTKGTAKKVFDGASYESSGKTGTAQVINLAEDEEYDEEKIAERHRDNAMYVGYAPYDAPEIVVSVAIENGGSGGSDAGPVAKALLDRYFFNKEKYIANANNAK